MGNPGSNRDLIHSPSMTAADASLRSPHVPLPVRLRNTLRKYGVLRDPGSWIDPAGQVLLCAYPRKNRDLASLRERGIRQLVNLDLRPHSAERLAEHGLSECHLPVRDFTAPTPKQLATAVARVISAVAAGERVAIHCGAGLGRAGTVAACYLVALGHDWRTAVTMVRVARVGAIETDDQLAAVAAYARDRM
jgi:atypical dual specificity phosphatase